MESYWFINKKTKAVVLISEKQFEAFGINKKESDWERTDPPENSVNEKSEKNKSLPKQEKILEKDGEKIRASEKQINALLKTGWKISADQEIAEPKEVIEEARPEAKSEDEIADDEITNFLGTLNVDNKVCWDDDGSVSQFALNTHFGEGKVTKEKVLEVWPEFNKTALE